jgi:hypothetical protein
LGVAFEKAPILAKRWRVTIGHSAVAPNYRDRENAGQPNSFILGSATQRDVAALFNPRYLPMMTLSSRLAATAFASLLLMGSAFAQTPAPATPAPAAKADTKMAPAEKKAEKPRSAASMECSKEADTKGVHGKERKKFMSECKKAAAGKK